MKANRKRKEKEQDVHMAQEEVNRKLMVAFAIFVVINILVVVFVLHNNNEIVLQGIGKIVSTAIREQPTATAPIVPGQSDTTPTAGSAVAGIKGTPTTIVLSSSNWDSLFIHYPATWQCASQIQGALVENPAITIDQDLVDDPDDEDPVGFVHVTIDKTKTTRTQLQSWLALFAVENSPCLESTAHPFGKPVVKGTAGIIQNEAIAGTTIFFDSDDDDEDNENDWLEEDEPVGKYNLSQSLPLIESDIVQAGYGTFEANNGAGVRICIVDAKINGTLHPSTDFVVTYGAKEKSYSYSAVSAKPGEDLHAEYLVQTIAPKSIGGLGAAPGADLMIASMSNLSKKSDLINGFVKGCTKNKKGPNNTNLVFDVMVTGANLGEVGGKLYTTNSSAVSGSKNIKAVDKAFKKYSRKNYKKKENNTVTSSKYNPRTRPIFVAAGQNFTTLPGSYNKLAVLDSAITVGAVADASGISYNPTVGTLSCSSGTLAPNKSLCDSAPVADIAAPGFEITISSGESVFGGYGSSLAAAHAAGVAAMIIAKPKAAPLTTAQILANLALSATNYASSFGQKPEMQGAGVIDAKIAVEAS